MTGWASRAQKSEGSLVSPGADSLLATISQLDPLYVNFSLSEAERLRLTKLISSGELKAPNATDAAAKSGEKSPLTGATVALKLSDGSIYDRKGRLTFVNPAINTATGAFEARAELPNRGCSTAARTICARDRRRRDASEHDRRAAARGDGWAARQVRLRYR